MSKVNLFIDDERFPPDDGKSWKIVRSSEEAICFFGNNGLPDHISFDHDLGGDDTSMIIIKWITGCILDTGYDEIPFSYTVHSQNPVGARNITGALTSLSNFLENKR